MKFHHLAVEGPIGVGKTTVVELLAQRLEADSVLEDWSTNPFLNGFYEGKPGAAFQAELFFLLSRHRQLQELQQRQLFAQATLTDYMFEKSRLFAYLNLDDSELLIFDKLYALLAESLPRPDLVLYLQASYRDPAEAARAARASRGATALGGVPRRAEPRVQPLLLPLLGDAAAGREYRRRRLRQARGRPRRPAQADPGHGQGHAVLRAARALSFPRARDTRVCARSLDEGASLRDAHSRLERHEVRTPARARVRRHSPLGGDGARRRRSSGSPGARCASCSPRTARCCSRCGVSRARCCCGCIACSCTHPSAS